MSNDVARQEIIVRIERVWTEYPEMRFFQLLTNLGLIDKEDEERTLFYKTDKEVVRRLRRFKGWEKA